MMRSYAQYANEIIVILVILVILASRLWFPFLANALFSFQHSEKKNILQWKTDTLWQFQNYLASRLVGYRRAQYKRCGGNKSFSTPPTAYLDGPIFSFKHMVDTLDEYKWCHPWNFGDSIYKLQPSKLTTSYPTPNHPNSQKNRKFVFSNFFFFFWWIV